MREESRQTSRDPWVAVLCLLVLFAACSPETGRDTISTSDAEAVSAVAEVGDEYFDHLLSLSPYLRLKVGLAITELPDLTEEASQELAHFATDLLARLPADDSGLAHEEWLSKRLLEWDLAGIAAAPEHYWADFDITPYVAGANLNLTHQVLNAHAFDEAEDLDAYLKLLEEYGDLIGQYGDKLVGQIERGIYLPKAQVPNVRGLFAGYQSRVDDLLDVAPARLEALSSIVEADAVSAFSDRVEASIGGRVVAAYERLQSLLGDDYLAAAPDTVGLGAVPGGDSLYRHRVRMHSTTELSAEEIHQIGLDQVAELDAQMAAVREQIGFEDSAAEFHQALRRDPRFLAASPQEVEERYMEYIRRIEPIVADYFSVLPEAPYGVRRLDPTAEASMTFGFYQPPTAANPKGEYHYNGSDLENRSLFPAGPMIYHELVPGHHFQIALQNERQDLPRFRREVAAYGAFTEGWAEYAANLGKEMGLYDDPYDLYARLVTEMFMSCRLVLDTGMNQLGWSLERAREFITPRVIYSDAEIATELMRYSADLHGQALGYRMGLLRITEARERAEEALGDDFDIKAFHAAVIGSGAMPMVVLDEHIEWWIEEQQRAP